MNKIISAFKTFWRTFVVVEDKADDKGYIHIITPKGEMEFKANFGDKNSIERALNIINKEKELRFSKEEYYV